MKNTKKAEKAYAFENQNKATMMRTISRFVFCSMLFFLLGCVGIGAGTHGSIKGYRYLVSKYLLEQVVHRVIARSCMLFVDSVKDEYNDGARYITMHIKEEGHIYTYTFHFYGGTEYWDTSKSSTISIAYAYNEKREGGSVGNGGVKWYNFKLRKELTEPFERLFISKIDSALSTKHTED